MYKQYQLSGLRLIPPEFVGVARQILVKNGIDPLFLSANGEMDPRALIALGYDTMTVRTNATPDMVTILNRNTPEDPNTTALLMQLQPTVIFQGRAGRLAFAPYGEAIGGSWDTLNIVGFSGVGAVALVASVGVLAGVLLTRLLK